MVLWNALYDGLRAGLDNEEFQVWIAPLRLMRQDAARLTLGCPNAFHRTWIRDNHLPRMREILAQLGQPLQIALEVLPAPQPAAKAAPQQLELPQVAQGRPRLNQRFIFDKFVAGTGNEFAWAAAKAMAQGQKLFSNTLFLVSGTGLGKSHLTQAVGHQVLTCDPGARVAYLTAEDFANQMIAALRNKRIEAFKDRYRRGCDVLLLEEVQFLAGKDKTQDELGYTLDALLDAGKRLVFTGATPAGQIKGLKRHLASRLSSGLTAAIEPPDHLTRVRILEHLSREEGVSVNPDVLEYLAQDVVGDVRRLQSALVGLLAKGSLTGRPLDLRLAAEVLGHMHLQLSRVTPEQILSLVAQVYGLERGLLTGRSRKKTVTRPRNLALYLCRRHTEASYAALGRAFNRDHSTVMYNVDQVERGLGSDPKLSQELAYLEQRLGLAGG
ncbi:MAG: chromosomal replication initiator protein DnaA [Desulfarculus sp.]|nr:chromosomal replication initiator protein DnaA [Desulfarculus sp.]